MLRSQGDASAGWLEEKLRRSCGSNEIVIVRVRECSTLHFTNANAVWQIDIGQANKVWQQKQQQFTHYATFIGGAVALSAWLCTA